MKLSTILFFISFIVLNQVTAQNIGINGTGANPNASALLDIDDAGTNTKGILIPRIPLTAINAATPVTSPATSLLVYNTASASTGTNAVSPGYYYWDGTKWVRFSYNQSGVSSNDWSIVGNSGTTAGTNFLGTTDNQDLVLKRNNIQSGLISGNGTSFGLSALNPINSGSGAAAFGVSALQNNTTGIYNTGLGFQSLMNNTTGSTNTGVGFQSLMSNIGGTNNTGIGVFALNLNTTGSSNTSIGINSLAKNTTGSYNVGTGSSSLFNNTTGSDNVGIGSSALQANTVGSYNTAIGSQALGANTTGSTNVASGYQSLSSNTTGSYNTANGFQSLTYNTTGNNNTAIGSQALSSNTTGSTNVAVGNIALFSNTTGTENTAVGMQALYGNTTGQSNTSVGFIALNGNKTGVDNTAVGRGALLQNSTGNANNAFGSGSLYSNTIGTQNSVFGNAAMSTNISGSYNIAMGQQALSLQTNGNYNSAIGYESLLNNQSSYNTGLGYLSGYYHVTGSNNVFIGNLAGGTFTAIANNNNNTFVGASADAAVNNLTNATAIGYNSKVGASNALILGGTGADAVNVGVGVTTPTAKLDVIGKTIVRLQATGNNTSIQFDPTVSETPKMSFHASDNTNRFNVVANLFSSQASDVLSFHSISTSNILNITNIGNVGIGTTSPGDKLSVGGRGEFQTTFNDHGVRISADPTNTHSKLQFTDIPVSIEWASITAVPAGGGAMNLITNNAPRVTVINNGFVGIGTSSPTSKLEVLTGSIKITNTCDNIYQSSQAGSLFDLVGTYCGWDPNAIYLGGYNINNGVGRVGDKIICGGSGGGLPIFATAFNITSTREKKKNINDLQYGLKEILKLKPVAYNYNFEKTGITHIGLIAEDVDLVIPEVVVKLNEQGTQLNNGGKPSAITYHELIPVLVKGIQEQQLEIDNLKQVHKSEIENLLKRIEALEKK